MKIFIKVFPMIFQSLMSPRKSRCDVPSGTTQGCFFTQIVDPPLDKPSNLPLTVKEWTTSWTRMPSLADPTKRTKSQKVLASRY